MRTPTEPTDRCHGLWGGKRPWYPNLCLIPGLETSLANPQSRSWIENAASACWKSQAGQVGKKRFDVRSGRHKRQPSQGSGTMKLIKSQLCSLHRRFGNKLAKIRNAQSGLLEWESIMFATEVFWHFLVQSIHWPHRIHSSCFRRWGHCWAFWVIETDFVC